MKQFKWHIVNKPVKEADLLSYTEIYFETAFFLDFFAENYITIIIKLKCKYAR